MGWRIGLVRAGGVVDTADGVTGAAADTGRVDGAGRAVEVTGGRGWKPGSRLAVAGAGIAIGAGAGGDSGTGGGTGAVAMAGREN